METAKVDIQKLQLLNDRINQTIDALNQVRSSVHGLQSGTPGFPSVPWQGLMHSPVGFGQIPYSMAPQLYASQAWSPQAWSPQASFIGQSMGLSHSPYDAASYVDPLLRARLQQTFPFAFAQVPIRY